MESLSHPQDILSEQGDRPSKGLGEEGSVGPKGKSAEVVRGPPPPTTGCFAVAALLSSDTKPLVWAWRQNVASHWQLGGRGHPLAHSGKKVQGLAGPSCLLGLNLLAGKVG